MVEAYTEKKVTFKRAGMVWGSSPNAKSIRKRTPLLISCSIEFTST